MKRYILIISIGFLCANFSFAQEAGTWRAGADIGMLRVKNSYNQPFGFGFLGATELKYNLRNNMNIGLRAEAAGFQNNVSDGGTIFSFSATYDYYFLAGKQFSPFAGAGLGYYFINHQYFGKEFKNNNPTCLARIGFEFRRFRTSLTYNFWIRSWDPLYPTFYYDRSYLSLTIGYYIGGGKRKLDAEKR